MPEEVLFRPLHNDFIKIVKIETHGISSDRKKVKLTNAIYHIEYLLNFKPVFTCYHKDVCQMVSFDRWIPIKNLTNGIINKN